VADVDDQDGTQARVAEELRIEPRRRSRASGPPRGRRRARRGEVARLEDGVEPCRLVAALRSANASFSWGAPERPWICSWKSRSAARMATRGSCCLGPVVVVHVGNEALFALGRAHVDQPEGCTFADVGAQRASSQMSASSSSLTGWSLKCCGAASVNKVARPRRRAHACSGFGGGRHGALPLGDQSLVHT